MKNRIKKSKHLLTWVGWSSGRHHVLLEAAPKSVSIAAERDAIFQMMSLIATAAAK